MPLATPPFSHAAALQFLAGRIDYERSQSMPCSEAAFKLDRMRELLLRLGSPQRGIPVVHVAGTKGKGSTSAMIAAMLTAAGHRAGLFTSPHLERVEERMAIDGRACSAGEFAELIEWARPAVETMDRKAADFKPPENGPTYFEILTAMAFGLFARHGVNAVVLEVGLGGRLDSTNVCEPCISVITSISLDHAKQLGDTLAAIAAEKAGIIKPSVPVVSGVDVASPREVIRRVARQNGCRLVELGVDFDFDYHAPKHLEAGNGERAAANFDFHDKSFSTTLSNVALGLLGRHQAANAAVALAVMEELRHAGWTIPEAAVRRGLAEIAWPARVEVVSRRPVVILDTAHNAASIAALMEVLEESFSVKRRFLLFAATKEKDLRGMLRLLVGRFDRIFFTRYTNNPRSVPPEELFSLAKELQSTADSRAPSWGDSSTVIPTTMTAITSTADAWREIQRLATPDDLICITGSFFLASEMRNHLAAAPLGA